MTHGVLFLFLETGDIACFNNHRVLHARDGFELSDRPVERLMDGGFIDWSEMLSRARVLQRQLQINDQDDPFVAVTPLAVD